MKVKSSKSQSKSVESWIEPASYGYSSKRRAVGPRTARDAGREPSSDILKCVTCIVTPASYHTHLLNT